MIDRELFRILPDKIGKGKVIILIGPRQVGKTTLIKRLLENEEFLFLDGDDPTVRSILALPNTEQLKNIIGKYKFVFVDEAQRIENIGVTLKIIADQFKDVQLLISGSSAFELNDKIKEPLTGRKWEFILYPISWKEYEANVGLIKAEQQLELRMVFGMYPDVINSTGNEYEILKELTESYLYKDILALNNIRKPAVLEKLLQALALQMGSEVSYNELSKLLGIDKNTVATYIDILEKAFVIFKLTSFSRNIRNEIKMNQKIYFFDNGIRNMIIGNLNNLKLRPDIGALWENFLISERIKKLKYNNKSVKSYFWRTTQQQEIDYVEEGDGKIIGYEIKWNANAKVKIPKIFSAKYDATTEIITRINFRTFI